MIQSSPIGVFDSGYGGLTVLRSIKESLPVYDYLYLGDSARTPYGTRSFESVYEFTWQGVRYLFEQGCSLVILACNTASAKALRSIQQRELPSYDPTRRVLGVIRPTTETIGSFSSSGHLGIMGTTGTVQSHSYPMEISKFFPNLKVYQEACPMWVPLVENGELDNPGTLYFVRQHIDSIFHQSSRIDTLLLACTHYPLLLPVILEMVGDRAEVISQGPIVANSLKNYLSRHAEIADRCTKNGHIEILTTDNKNKFEQLGSLFFGTPIQARQVHL